MKRLKNPLSEMMLLATATAIGIVVGTVAATLILERIQTSKQLSTGTPAS